MKKIFLSITYFTLSLAYFGQYCSNGGPSSTFDSNVESVFLLQGSNSTSINYIGCPGVTGVENQSTLTVDLIADSSYVIDVQFGTCGGNYNSAGEVWIDWNQNTIFESTESIGTWSGTPPTPLSNFTFTVPSIAFSGITGIRVMQYEGGSLPLDPCFIYMGICCGFFCKYFWRLHTNMPAPPIQFMAAINVTASDATLQWVPAGVETEWIVEYGLAGFTQGNGTSSLEVINKCSYYWIVPITAYDFYIQAICGPGDTSLMVRTLIHLSLLCSFNSSSIRRFFWWIPSQHLLGSCWRW